MTWADVAVSAFFAQHRPVSISYPVPLTHSTNLFDSIFAPPQSPFTSATSSTVSPSRTSTVYHASPVASDFETVDMTASSPTFEAAVRSAHNAPHNNHNHNHHYRKQSQPSPPEEAEGEPSPSSEATATATSSSPDYTTYYRPFRPPPAPRAQTAFLRPRLRKQFIELFLRIAASHPSPGTTVAISGNSKLLLQSMMGHRGGLDGGSSSNSNAINGQERIFMRLISVKRIRKLKMKKHKLRKLRKRTRSLRRRVESQRK